jgi:hypothetical protein
MKQKNIDELEFVIKVTKRVVLVFLYFVLIGIILTLAQ